MPGWIPACYVALRRLNNIHPSPAYSSIGVNHCLWKPFFWFLDHDRVAIGHAILACIATLRTIPAALLFGRYCYSNPNWIVWHIGLNAATTLLIILVFATGMISVASADLGTQFKGPNSAFDHKARMDVFVVVLLETLLGVLAERPKRVKS